MPQRLRDGTGKLPSAENMTAKAIGPVAVHPGAPADHPERRDRRERQAWRSGNGMVVSKLANVLTRLVTVPLSLHLLGTDRYGLWLTVGSVLTWLAVYDLGLSSGLLNTVSAAYGHEDWQAIRRHVSTAFFSLAAMSSVMLAVVLGASRWAGLPGLLGIQAGSPLAGDAVTLLLISGTYFATAFTVNSANYFASAVQEGYLTAYAQTSASLLTCILLVLLSLGKPSLAQFALVMGCPTVLATTVLAGYLFLSRYRAARPAIRFYSFDSLRAISACGTPILMSQLADLAIIYSANLVISHRLGPSTVPSYAVPFSALMVASTICYGLAAPYQAAYAEAMARGDIEWIRQTAFRVLKRNMAIISACGVAFAVAGPVGISIWTRGKVTPSFSLLGAMAIYSALSVWATSNGVLLNGIGRVKTKAAMHSSVAAAFVLAAWFSICHLGLMAVPLAGIAAHLLDLALSLPLALQTLGRRLSPAASVN